MSADLREALKDALAFIEATSIEVAEHNNDYWLQMAAPYYVGFNLGRRNQKQTVNGNVSVIDRNTERWRTARAELLTRLHGAVVAE